MKTGIELIEAERKRQFVREHWTPEHDDQHTKCELRRVAEAYATAPSRRRLRKTQPFRGFTTYLPADWPKDWHWSWWKPSPGNRVRDLVKAGALFLAEAERCARRGRYFTTRLMVRRARQCAALIDYHLQRKERS